MEEIEIVITGFTPSQSQAQQIAQIIAAADMPETLVISRFNKAANACSPCCLKNDLGGKPGWEVYGENHGGRLKITVNGGEYVFMFS